MNRLGQPGSHGARGFTLVEVMIALVLLAIGIMALASLFPTGMRSQVSSRVTSTAAQYADQEFETLRGLTRTSALLTPGRHPGSGYDTLGTSRSWTRYYVVTQMPAPLDSLLKIRVGVRWQSTKPESVAMSGYLFP